MSINPNNLDSVVQQIRRRYDLDIRRGDEYDNPSRISTGSLELDMATGGGIPVGRFSRFYGAESSGKTLVSLKVIAAAQALGLSCAYYNIEKQYDSEFSAELGVNTHDLIVVEGTTIEEIGEKMESLLSVVNVHVLDSVSAAVSLDELEAKLGEWRPGITARAWGKVFRRLNERFDHIENTVLLIDQVRSNFATGGEDPAGGRIIGHQSSMSIHFKKGNWLWKNEAGELDDKAKQSKGSSGQAEPAGREIKARVVKSRVCRPLLTATMWLDFGNSHFDDTFEFVKAAKHYGYVETKGAYFYIKNGKEQRLHGLHALKEYIMNNPKFREEIREGVLKLAATW